MTEAQRLRRKKRQDKLANRKLIARTIKKLFGDTTTTLPHYVPDKDPKKNNKYRLTEKRMLTGRITLNGKRFNRTSGEFDA